MACGSSHRARRPPASQPAHLHSDLVLEGLAGPPQQPEPAAAALHQLLRHHPGGRALGDLCQRRADVLGGLDVPGPGGLAERADLHNMGQHCPQR